MIKEYSKNIKVKLQKMFSPTASFPVPYIMVVCMVSTFFSHFMYYHYRVFDLTLVIPQIIGCYKVYTNVIKPELKRKGV